MRRATASGAEQGPANCPASPRPARRGASRGGLTLVEMMVSVTITLLVVFAIVQVFDMMGNTVAMGRATMEMAGQLRSVSQLLQQDLDHLTCPVRPWIDPDAGLGYFEYVEGPREINLGQGVVMNHRSCDFDHDGDTFGLQGQVSAGQPTDAQYPGDIDDILAFTARSPSDTEFVGRTPGGIQKSKMAEIVWWMALVDSNGNGVPDENDAPVLLRRVFLIRPDISITDAPDTFFFNYDLSARIDTSTTPASLIANSLGDVTNRQNRFAHRPLYQDTAGEWTGFPHDPVIYVPDEPDPVMKIDDVLTDDSESFAFEHEQMANDHIDPAQPISGAELQRDTWEAVSQGLTAPNPSVYDYPYPSAMIPRFITQEAMKTGWSAFVVATDVVAFDVRAYDPDALGYIKDGVPLLPSDVEYAGPYQQFPQTGGSEPIRNEATWLNLKDLVDLLPGSSNLFFRGGYVDLHWRRPVTSSSEQPFFVPLKNAASSKNIKLRGAFSENMDPKSFGERISAGDPSATRFVFYDTWSLGYEKDGIDQDQTTDSQTEVDEGFDGIDNLDIGQGFDGVDDVSERETRPPYDAPLRGIEVRIRQIEVSTGQVRQVSVVGDFTD